MFQLHLLAPNSFLSLTLDKICTGHFFLYVSVRVCARARAQKVEFTLRRSVRRFNLFRVFLSILRNLNGAKKKHPPRNEEFIEPRI